MDISGPVLVTGASTGIGRCIAETLAKDDLTVYATARKDAASLSACRRGFPHNNL